MSTSRLSETAGDLNDINSRFLILCFRSPLEAYVQRILILGSFWGADLKVILNENLTYNKFKFE